MSDYADLHHLAGHVATMDRGDPMFLLEAGTGRRIAKALVAALASRREWERLAHLYGGGRAGSADQERLDARLDALEAEAHEAAAGPPEPGEGG